MKDEVKQEILRVTGMQEGTLPFKYLGVPLSTQRLNVMQCQFLVQKLLARISGWAVKLLSYAGRVQLIKSVLFEIQMYWCQVLVLPQKVVKMIQAACRIFLWTGKVDVSRRALVAWDKVMLPSMAGGLNILNLKYWNRAAICKLLWNLAQKKDKIWVQWVHGYYIKRQDLYEMKVPMQSSWIIRKIFGMREHLRKLQNGREWLERDEFSMRNMYKEFVGVVEKVPWAKLLCQNAAPPKCIFIVWLLMHGKLATCEYLQKLGVDVDQTCCLCNQAMETVEHLFFECAVSGEVWRVVTRWCRIQEDAVGWGRARERLVVRCTTNSGMQRLYRCVATVLVYHVWLERNARRMQGKVNSVEGIVRVCKEMIAWCGRKDKKIGKLVR